jgi:hypothetical protein
MVRAGDLATQYGTARTLLLEQSAQPVTHGGQERRLQ